LRQSTESQEKLGGSVFGDSVKSGTSIASIHSAGAVCLRHLEKSVTGHSDWSVMLRASSNCGN
jgi:hypothetical protein